MVAYTTEYNLAKPTVGDDEDLWGGYLNGNFDKLENLLKGTTALTTIDVTGNITVGGTVDGVDIATFKTSYDSHTHAFDDLTGKTSGTGAYSTSSHLTSGRGSGGVSLTINDGYGNANVTFNHKSGTPEQNGKSARIVVNTDSTTANDGSMSFQLGSGTNGVAAALTEHMRLTEAGDLGIGTTSPVSDLHVASVSGAVLTLESTDTTLNADDIIGGIDFLGSDASDDGNETLAFIRAISQDSTPDSALIFGTLENIGAVDDTVTERMRITSSGSVGIGTSSPSTDLHIASTTGGTISLEDTDNGFAATTINVENGGRDLEITVPQDTIFTQGSTEAMRIDSSGNLLVGKAATDTSVEGFEYRAGSTNYLYLAKSGGVSAYFDRKTSDGDIIEFRKDGTTVGNIGSKSSAIFVGTGDTGVRFDASNNQVRPWDTSTNLISDGNIGLGSAAGRFKDLYLSGDLSDGTTSLAVSDIVNTQTIARRLGWEPAYGNASESTVYYDATEDAVVSYDATDTTIGAAFRAIRVANGETVRFTIALKGETATTTGLYLRLYQHNGDLPDGKTHVSHNATDSSAFVQEDDSGITNWVENQAVPTTWTTYEYDYTATADGYVSFVLLNWTGAGTQKIWFKQPDIQKKTTTVAGNAVLTTADFDQDVLTTSSPTFAALTITNQLEMSNTLDMNNYDIYGVDQIFHHGDTDTYIQFHASNQFRVVTGGAERFEVNNTRTQADRFLSSAAIGETRVLSSGTSVTCDPDSGGSFSLTMTGNTTFTFGAPALGNVSTGFIIELTGNGGTVTWPTSVEWAGGTAPDAPASGETDIYVFWTRDAGTTWYGVQSIDAAA